MTLPSQCERVAAMQRGTHRPTPCGYKPPLLSRLAPADATLLAAQGWITRNTRAS